MALYKKPNDKKSGDGLALTEWNDLSSAVAGNAGLTLAISPDDKVGIGTSTPDAKLDVKGTGKLGTAVLRGSERASHFNYGAEEETVIRGGKANSNVVINDNGGNVGIGTTSPAEKLDVEGNVKAARFIGDGSQLTNLGMGATGLNLATTANSKVGIGTTNPLGPLSIGDSSVDHSDGFLVIGKKKGNHTRHFRMGFDDNFNFSLGDFGHNNKAETWKKPFAIQWAAPDSSFYMDSAGKIGLGTTTPAAKLHVINAETDANGNTLTLGPSGSNGSSLRLGYHKDYSWIQSHGSKPLQINPLGNEVQIGAPLRLNGAGNNCQISVESNRLVFQIKSSHHGQNRGISWDGDTNWDAYSDQRLKTNIIKEKDILPRLMQLDVKNYNWKDDPKRKLKLIGFMAQDVKPLFPSLVGEMEDAETKETNLTLKYASFGVLAVGAIKELKQEYDKRIAALEAEVAGLKKALVVH
ncbi:MAG: tail fiber domain-containing protein [Bacteroidales bacterium]|nr:tail fiber domain-containing protein [Bacteroidales bacterium]